MLATHRRPTLQFHGARDRRLYQPRNLTRMLSKSHPTSTRSVCRSLRATSSLSRRHILSVHTATRILPVSSIANTQPGVPGPNFPGPSRHFATTSKQRTIRITTARVYLCIVADHLEGPSHHKPHFDKILIANRYATDRSPTEHS